MKLDGRAILQNALAGMAVVITQTTAVDLTKQESPILIGNTHELVPRLTHSTSALDKLNVDMRSLVFKPNPEPPPVSISRLPAVAPAAKTKASRPMGPEAWPDNAPALIRHSLFEIKPLAYYSKISGTDPRDSSKATLISTLNYGIALKWQRILSDRFRVLGAATFRHEEYLPDPSATSAQLHNFTQFLLSFQIGTEYELTKSFSLQGNVGISKELYYRGSLSAVGGIVLFPLVVPRLEIGGRYLIWGSANSRVDLQTLGLILMPSSSNSNFETKLGTGLEGLVSFTRSFSRFSVRTDIYYQYLRQDTSILKVNRQDVGFSVGLGWRFGSKKCDSSKAILGQGAVR